MLDVEAVDAAAGDLANRLGFRAGYLEPGVVPPRLRAGQVDLIAAVLLECAVFCVKRLEIAAAFKSENATAQTNAAAAQQLGGLAVGPNLANFMRPGETIPPMLPAAEALHKARMANFMADRPSSQCLPHGIPDQMLIGVPLKIVQDPGLTLILYEEFARFRQIFTDGRPPAPIASPAWLGYSTGKWEGDWFVIDTRGFNDKSWLDDSGRPHTEQLHTQERFHRVDFGHLEAEIVIDDPGAYTAKWSFPLLFEFLPDTEMIEDVCDNERDSRHSVGK